MALEEKNSKEVNTSFFDPYDPDPFDLLGQGTKSNKGNKSSKTTKYSGRKDNMDSL